MATQANFSGAPSALLAVIALSLAACTQAGVTQVESKVSGPQPQSTSAETETGKLTVKESSSNTPDSGLTLAQTQDLPDLEIEAWLGADVALVSAVNKSLPKYDSYVDGMVYPRSLYLYDIKTHDKRPVLERPGVSLSVDAVSPGGHYLTVWEYVVGDNELSVLDLDTGATVDLGSFTHVSWVDSDTLVGHNFHGSGLVTYTVGDAEPTQTSTPADLLTLAGATTEYVYYSNEDNELRRFDRATEEIVDIPLENVGQLEISPDETQLAITVFADSGAEQLYVCDQVCSNPTPISEVEGRAFWSPNMQMLAYRTKEGLLIKDFLYGNTTKVLLGVDFYRITWNTTSTRMGISTVDENDVMSGTVLATLSGPATQ